MNGLLLTDAAAAAGATAGNTIVLIVWVLAIVFFTYFIMIKPQKKEQKRVSAMLSDLEVGDVVLLNCGFYGTLIDVSDDSIIVEFGNNKNCRIPMEKTAIKQVEKANQ